MKIQNYVYLKEHLFYKQLINKRDKIPYWWHGWLTQRNFRKLDRVSFAQWHYRSQWGSSEARLLLIENFSQYPARRLEIQSALQFLMVHTWTLQVIERFHILRWTESVTSPGAVGHRYLWLKRRIIVELMEKTFRLLDGFLRFRRNITSNTVSKPPLSM